MLNKSGKGNGEFIYFNSLQEERHRNANDEKSKQIV